MGASGIYSMVLVIGTTLFLQQRTASIWPLSRPFLLSPASCGLFSAVSSMNMGLGGGFFISSKPHSNSVCLLQLTIYPSSIPGGLIALIIIVLLLPSSDAGSDLKLAKRFRQKLTKSALVRVDYFGMFLLLVSSVLLIFALEEGGTRFPWDSPAIIANMTLAMAMGLGFVGWEWFIDGARSVQEPVFPPSILQDRLISVMML